MSHLFTPVPFSTTNKDADGIIGTYTAPAVVVLLIILFGTLNALLWGAIGIWQAVQFIVG